MDATKRRVTLSLLTYSFILQAHQYTDIINGVMN